MASWLSILTFHSIDDLQFIISFPPKLFAYGMARLHANGYQTLNLLEAVEYVRQGATFPKRTFVLTFDDGFETVYREAFPVLQCYHMSATVSLTVGGREKPTPNSRPSAVDGRPMLSWGQIQELHRYDIAFGAHTLTHPDLTRLPPYRVAEEVYGSKALIEDMLGSEVACFAYPYGRYDEHCRSIVQQHFQCACSDKLGLIMVHSDPYALERVEAYYLRAKQWFDLMRTPYFPWYIRGRNIPRQWHRAWLRLWE